MGIGGTIEICSSSRGILPVLTVLLCFNIANKYVIGEGSFLHELFDSLISLLVGKYSFKGAFLGQCNDYT